MSSRVRIGRVLSNKMDKTVVVMVETLRRHPRYKRVVRYRRKFKAHDEQNACCIGDLVRIIETHPLSKEKRWRVAEILSKEEIAEAPPMETEEMLSKEEIAEAPPMEEEILTKEEIAEAPPMETEEMLSKEEIAEAPPMEEEMLTKKEIAEAPPMETEDEQ
jgi:small subunit ribosomal protein S17